jgi:hypothetical protein
VAKGGKKQERNIENNEKRGVQTRETFEEQDIRQEQRENVRRKEINKF